MSSGNRKNLIQGEGLGRRSALKAGAWSVPVVAVSVSAPAAAASPVTSPWNLQVEAVCGDESWFREAAGFRITNTGSEPIPAGTVFTWTQFLHVEGSTLAPPWEYSSRRNWADKTVIKNELISASYITVGPWSKWVVTNPSFGYRYGDKSRTVTYTVGSQGHRQGYSIYIGTRATRLRRGFWMSLDFTSGNGGSITGDESARLGTGGWLITGCEEQEDNKDTLSPAELQEAEEEAARITAGTTAP
ncbi:hypothetical protein [Arthrobacter sp. NPDC090010]|uniref:hypothetical protein n=1 Tax=Arthrobacter sp. NPDC090010 TaxID=3363942 RepID=UPI00382BE191